MEELFVQEWHYTTTTLNVPIVGLCLQIRTSEAVYVQQLDTRGLPGLPPSLMEQPPQIIRGSNRHTTEIQCTHKPLSNDKPS